jgi:hypothetical protein
MPPVRKSSASQGRWHFLFSFTYILYGIGLFSVIGSNPRSHPTLTDSNLSSHSGCACTDYSKVFCDALCRFSETSITDRRPPDNGQFALFLLVRETSILSPLVQGSADFFAKRCFDEIFVFNEEGINGRRTVENYIMRFVDVSWLWSSYPPGFDPNATSSSWVVKNVKWGYQHMIRFFWRSVFLLPEIENVTAYMRLDGDSCIGAGGASPRELLRKDVVYVKNGDFLDHAGVCTNLETLARDYVRYFGINVRNPGAWEGAFSWGAVMGYYNNLELMDIRFWMRPEVQHFVEFVDASWGTYLWRWGDAPLRYVALAMFATPGMIVERPFEWRYDHPCRVN